jgi:hypothetical protein
VSCPNRQNGLLIKPKDVSNLLEAINYLLIIRIKRKLGEKGKNTFWDLYLGSKC